MGDLSFLGDMDTYSSMDEIAKIIEKLTQRANLATLRRHKSR